MTFPEQRSHARAPLQPLGPSTPWPLALQTHALGTVRAEVLDISEGGVQILSRHDLRLTGKSFHLQVVVCHRDSTEVMDGGEIQGVWSHSGQAHSRSGFLVRADRKALAHLVQKLRTTAPRVLHCMLHPVVASV